MLTFTGDCKKILVANEGRPGKDINNVFIDPAGSVTVIERERSGSPPSERLVLFTGQNQRSYRNPGQSVVKLLHIRRRQINQKDRKLRILKTKTTSNHIKNRWNPFIHVYIKNIIRSTIYPAITSRWKAFWKEALKLSPFSTFLISGLILGFPSDTFPKMSGQSNQLQLLNKMQLPSTLLFHQTINTRTSFYRYE